MVDEATYLIYVAGTGVLLLLSDTPRALSKRQRLWAAALANKLAAVRVEAR